MRNTVQRDEILKFLRSQRAHFSATQVYDAVREQIPNISLGTVYRNLGKLVESRDIITVETEDKCLYYDGYTKEHSHFVCKGCGEIYDFDPVDTCPVEIIEKGFKIEMTRTVFYGQCPNCKNKF